MKVIKISASPREESSSPLFTGSVTMQPIINESKDTPFSISQVNFGKGVRNKLHTHTVAQVLIVTAGKGIVATEKERVTVGVGDAPSTSRREKNTGMALPPILNFRTFTFCRRAIRRLR